MPISSPVSVLSGSLLLKARDGLEALGQPFPVGEQPIPSGIAPVPVGDGIDLLVAQGKNAQAHTMSSPIYLNRRVTYGLQITGGSGEFLSNHVGLEHVG